MTRWTVSIMKENSLLKLIKMVQEKQTKGGWQDSFVLKDGSQDYWANVDVDDMNRMAE